MRPRKRNKNGSHRSQRIHHDERPPIRCGASSDRHRNTATRTISTAEVKLHIANGKGFAQGDGRWGAQETARPFTCHAAILAFAVQNGIRQFSTVAVGV